MVESIADEGNIQQLRDLCKLENEHLNKVQEVKQCGSRIQVVRTL